MHMMRTLIAAAGGLLLVGCAVPATNTNPGEDHPANPGAAEAPPPSPSNTLAIDDSSLPPKPAADAEVGMHDRMQHGMAGMSHDMSGNDSTEHQGHGMAHETAATRPGEKAAPSAPRMTPATAPATSAATYTCPMHKEVVSGQPGRCPKCGMKLVEKKAVTRPGASTPNTGAREHSGHGGHQ